MSLKPVKPDESDCCGSGCNPCILDVYQERLKKWESKQEEVISSNALSQIKYLPFLITSIQCLGETIKTFTFQAVVLKDENSNLVQVKDGDYEILKELLCIKSGEYLIMKGTFEEKLISRSYTPVLDKENFQKGVFTIVISLLPNGKMSAFFKTLQQGDIVYWRGPYRELNRDLRSYKHILLFGGGTGIVPLYNVAKSIIENEESETWVKLFASFKSTGSIILRTECGLLRDFWNFQMSAYITGERENTNFRARYNETVIFGKIDESVIQNEVKKCGGDKFFVIVCGPEGFNEFIKNSCHKSGVENENIFIFY